MIVISCYNPLLPRSSEDEELLSTLLASLIIHRVRCVHYKTNAKAEEVKAHWENQFENTKRLIQLTFPLLGLDFEEVYEMIKMEEQQWLIDPTGKR